MSDIPASKTDEPRRPWARPKVLGVALAVTSLVNSLPGSDPLWFVSFAFTVVFAIGGFIAIEQDDTRRTWEDDQRELRRRADSTTQLKVIGVASEEQELSAAQREERQERKAEERHATILAMIHQSTARTAELVEKDPDSPLITVETVTTALATSALMHKPVEYSQSTLTGVLNFPEPSELFIAGSFGEQRAQLGDLFRAVTRSVDYPPNPDDALAEAIKLQQLRERVFNAGIDKVITALSRVPLPSPEEMGQRFLRREEELSRGIERLRATEKETEEGIRRAQSAFARPAGPAGSITKGQAAPTPTVDESAPPPLDAKESPETEEGK